MATAVAVRTGDEREHYAAAQKFQEYYVEKWRADFILIGVTSGVEECLRETQARFDQVRADTAGFVNTLKDRERQVSAREDAVSARERAVLDLVGGASKLLDRLERHRADAEKFAEEPPLPPGEEPAQDELMQPCGHLHEVPAKEEPDLDDPELSGNCTRTRRSSCHSWHTRFPRSADTGPCARSNLQRLSP